MKPLCQCYILMILRCCAYSKVRVNIFSSTSLPLWMHWFRCNYTLKCKKKQDHERALLSGAREYFISIYACWCQVSSLVAVTVKYSFLLLLHEAFCLRIHPPSPLHASNFLAVLTACPLLDVGLLKSTLDMFWEGLWDYVTIRDLNANTSLSLMTTCSQLAFQLHVKAD